MNVCGVLKEHFTGHFTFFILTCNVLIHRHHIQFLLGHGKQIQFLYRNRKSTFFIVLCQFLDNFVFHDSNGIVRMQKRIRINNLRVMAFVIGNFNVAKYRRLLFRTGGKDINLLHIAPFVQNMHLINIFIGKGSHPFFYLNRLVGIFHCI